MIELDEVDRRYALYFTCSVIFLVASVVSLSLC